MRWLLWMTLVVALGGCGETSANGDLLGVQRLALDPHPVGPLEGRVVASYTPGDPDLPWVRKQDASIPVVDSAGRKAVRLDYPHPVNVRVKAPRRTTEFDRVDIEARVPAGESTLLCVSLYEGRRSALVSDVRTVVGTGRFETITFLMNGIERLDVALTEVTVQVLGDGTWSEIARVDLVDERGAALLATPGERAELADIRGELRRGWGIDRSMGGKTRLPDRLPKNARLHLSFATRPRQGGSVLRIAGLAAGRSEHPLEGEAGWRSATHDLEPADAGRQITFTIEGRGPAAASTAVAELQLEPRPKAEPAPNAPLVLLITSDTHRGDHLGRGGTPGLVRTPTIDALALRGVQFTDAFAPTNLTNPSHVSLMTGVSPRDTRIVGNRAPLSEEAVTLAERFAEAGWATAAAVSVQHIGAPYSGLGQGFDRYNGLEERVDYAYDRRGGEIAIEVARRWIEERRSVPMFVWVHVFDVHGPYAAPEVYESRYLPPGTPGAPAALDPVPAGDFPAWIENDPQRRTEVRDAHARYRAAVDYLDTLLRPLLEHPRALRGIVAFTADHGESFGRHQLWWTHHGLYRDQLHVPLIVSAPGLPTGVTREQPVEILNLGASLLSLAGVEPGPYPAKALDFLGTQPPEPRFALGYSGLKASVAHEGWLLVMNLVDHNYERGPRRFNRGDLELYHLELDPMCERDLTTAEPERAQALRAALVRWLDRADPRGYATMFNLNADAEQRLIELGYAGATESSKEGAWYVPD